ncbi:MAG: nucleotide exchange factor GrpE [Candidatus Aegiribacteria sp.]|nr:nucleotide exchange factor GrpE [Candidatus Aegiribacteria sp.]
MAGKSGKTGKSGKVEAALSAKQFKELSKNLQNMFKKNTKDLRNLMNDTKSQIADIHELLQTELEKQKLDILAALRSAGDCAKRSDNSAADILSQVSSLRDYLAKQQNMVKRFQDGYDWTVLKNFCQRIIRCIDDIEKRTNSLKEATDAHRQDLEMIYDQLVFALDGSGIEQFKPEVDTPYSGQEKIAEVVGKDPCEKGVPGDISQVVNPGYLYYISDEHQKLIRPAKVKLYEKQSEGSDDIE